MTIAVGVASPKAQGHAMIKTDMSAVEAYMKLGSGPAINQIKNTMIPIAKIVGTKNDAILSARI